MNGQAAGAVHGDTGVGRSQAAAKVLAAAAAVRPELAARADEVDRQRRISDEVYEMLQANDLLRIFKPRRYGGLELTAYEHAMVTMELARGCASTAWVFSLLNSDNLFALAFPEEAQEDMWGRDPSSTLAGSVFVNPANKARRVDGGYRLTGRFSFCSGSDYANWLIFNCLVDGAEPAQMFLVPKSDCTVVDDWFTLGMRGTGSRTMATDDVFVPAHRVIPAKDVFGPSKFKALHPTFDLLNSGHGSVGIYMLAAVTIGTALGVLDYVSGEGKGAQRLATPTGGAVRLAESDSMLLKFAESSAEADIGRFRIEHGSRLAAERSRRREAWTRRDIAVEARDYSYLSQLALRSVDRMHAALGAKACIDGHPVGRAMRDVHTACSHVSLSWDRAVMPFSKAAFGMIEL